MIFYADLEVTGVSRSGRVRKKSSKLTDFESPDEIEKNFKRQTPVMQRKPEMDYQSGRRADKSYSPMHKGDESYTSTEIDEKSEYAYGDAFMQDSASDYEASQFDESKSEVSDESDDSADSDYEEEETSGFRRLDVRATDDSSSQQNLYVSDKGKRLVIKDGKIVGQSRLRRREKGI